MNYMSVVAYKLIIKRALRMDRPSSCVEATINFMFLATTRISNSQDLLIAWSLKIKMLVQSGSTRPTIYLPDKKWSILLKV